MLKYSVSYRLSGTKIFHDEVTGRNFAEVAYAFASKMTGSYVVLSMRFIEATKI